MSESIAEMVLPGTYIEVRSEGLIAVGSIATGNVGIVGTAARGPLNEVAPIGGLAEAIDLFGPADAFGPRARRRPAAHARPRAQAGVRGRRQQRLRRADRRRRARGGRRAPCRRRPTTRFRLTARERRRRGATTSPSCVVDNGATHDAALPRCR